MADPYEEFMDPEKEYGEFMDEETPSLSAPVVTPPTAHPARGWTSVGDRAQAALTGFGSGGLPGATLAAMYLPESEAAVARSLMSGDARTPALGVSQGGTFGYADELGGLIGRFLAKGQPARLGPAFRPSAEDAPETAAMKQAARAGEGPASDYSLVRDRMRGEAKAAQEDSPWLYGGGQLGGALAASYLTRKAVPNLGRMSGPGGAAVQGGVEGAISGLGTSDADLTLGDVGSAALDTGLSMALGAGGGAAGEYLGQGLSALGSWAGRRAGNALSQGSGSLEDGLRRWAQERALKAAGFIQSDFPDDPMRLRRTMESGGVLLDDPGLVRPGNSVSEIREKLEGKVAEEGRAIGRYLDAADAAPFDPSQGYVPASFDPAPLARTATDDIARVARRDPSLVPQANRIQGWAEDLMAGDADRIAAGVPFTFREANRMKGRLQDFVYGSRSGDVPLNKELADDLQRSLIREIDDQVTPLLGPEAVVGFQQARRRFGTFDDVLEKARRGEKREVGNQFLGLGDRVQGAAAQSMDPTGGIATGLLSKAVRGRADSAAAVGANVLSRNVPQVTPEAMSAAGAAVGAGLGRFAGAELQDWLREVLASDPEAASRWAGALGAASEHGPEGLASAHYQLAQQDPEYQARMRNAGGQQQ